VVVNEKGVDLDSLSALDWVAEYDEQILFEIPGSVPSIAFLGSCD